MATKALAVEEIVMATKALAAAARELSYAPYDEHSRRNLTFTRRKVEKLLGIKDPFDFG